MSKVMSTTKTAPSITALGLLGWTWAMAGIFTILLLPIYRLSLVTLKAFDSPVLWWYWIPTLMWLVFMIYAEGWRGFHRAWAPRTAKRANYLLYHPTVLRVLLAPLYCMCFFDASRKRKLVAWILTSFIVLLVIVVGYMPQPWRGLIDLGVVAGLCVGTASLVYHTFRATGREPVDDSALGLK